jgi:hypothetical protein
VTPASRASPQALLAGFAAASLAGACASDAPAGEGLELVAARAAAHPVGGAPLADWPEVHGLQQWAWVPGDAPGAGRWILHPPRDFAVQVLGAERSALCGQAFAKGATQCLWSFEGGSINLQASGSAGLTLDPVVLRTALDASSREPTIAAVDADGALLWVMGPDGGRLNPDGSKVSDLGAGAWAQ